MVKLSQPKPFTFEAGERSILLLHGFTGNTADVRMLGRFLQKKGYTSHAPQYKGHGQPFEELVKYGANDWWEDVLEGYHHLKNLGYKEIAVAGLSLGGVFSLKLGYSLPVKAVIPMCAPMYPIDMERMRKGFLENARKFKQWERKAPDQIDQEIAALNNSPLDTIYALQQLNEEVRKHVDMIYAPTLVIQARQDAMIEINSATFIYEEVQSSLKEIIWYEESGHVITLDKERDKLHEDIFAFLEKLDWEE